jgi:hypothetical protein
MVEAYLQPFFSVNRGTAIRSLTVVVNDENHEFAKHASDYSLWELGYFDDSNGVLTPNSDPNRILNLSELKKSE